MQLRILPILIILILCSFSPFAQQRAYYGRIVSKDNKGIPNSFIKIKKANISYPCDQEGVFSFKADISTSDSFVFYGQGYEKATILVDVLPDDSIIVELRKDAHRLQEATIGAKGGRVVEERAGSGKSIHNAGCYLTFKDEIALYLPVDSTKNALLQEVNVYITKDGKAPENKFLVHLYQRDSTGAPGEEITDTLLVLHARKGNEWVHADLSNRKIPVKSGMFVSVQWVVGYGNDGFPWPMFAPSNYYAGEDSLREFYNGQVLGLTWLNDARPIVYRRYAKTSYSRSHPQPDKWFLTEPLVGGRKRNECITPMINFTYTYVEH